jgi:hypothetical protein
MLFLPDPPPIMGVQFRQEISAAARMISGKITM